MITRRIVKANIENVLKKIQDLDVFGYGIIMQRLDDNTTLLWGSSLEPVKSRKIREVDLDFVVSQIGFNTIESHRNNPKRLSIDTLNNGVSTIIDEDVIT